MPYTSWTPEAAVQQLQDRGYGEFLARSLVYGHVHAHAAQYGTPAGGWWVDEYDLADIERKSADAHQAVRNAYASVGQPGDWVNLTKLREAMPGMTRAEQDAALDLVALGDGVHVNARVDHAALTDADRASAVRLGGQDRHMILIEHARSGDETGRDTGDSEAAGHYAVVRDEDGGIAEAEPCDCATGHSHDIASLQDEAADAGDTAQDVDCAAACAAAGAAVAVGEDAQDAEGDSTSDFDAWSAETYDGAYAADHQNADVEALVDER